MGQDITNFGKDLGKELSKINPDYLGYSGNGIDLLETTAITIRSDMFSKRILEGAVKTLEIQET